MTVKYVCMIEGCDFITENEEEAKAHMTAHPDVSTPHMAKVTPAEEDVNCESM